MARSLVNLYKCCDLWRCIYMNVYPEITVWVVLLFNLAYQDVLWIYEHFLLYFSKFEKVRFS